jgi:hypothetical protein
MNKTSMSRKDYILIADILTKQKPYIPGEAFKNLTDMFAAALKAENPAFNSEHFLSVVNGNKGLQSRPPRQVAKLLKKADRTIDTAIPNQKPSGAYKHDPFMKVQPIAEDPKKPVPAWVTGSDKTAKLLKKKA